LIDNVADIDPSWFHLNSAILVTAGASAPECVVQECVEFLETRYQARVEVRSVREERVKFQLSKELHKLVVPRPI